MTDHVARAETDITAPPERVWTALTEPAEIKQYMFDTDVSTDWTPGSPITWSGSFQGRDYTDRGTVLDVQAGRRLQVTHYSPLSGMPDRPESYHTIEYALQERDGGTHLTLSQDGNATPEEAEHAHGMWQQLLDALKQHVETSGGAAQV